MQLCAMFLGSANRYPERRWTKPLQQSRREWISDPWRMERQHLFLPWIAPPTPAGESFNIWLPISLITHACYLTSWEKIENSTGRLSTCFFPLLSSSFLGVREYESLLHAQLPPSRSGSTFLITPPPGCVRHGCGSRPLFPLPYPRPPPPIGYWSCKCYPPGTGSNNLECFKFLHNPFCYVVMPCCPILEFSSLKLLVNDGPNQL